MNPKTWVEAIVELIWRIGARILLWGGLVYFLYRVRSVIAAIIIAAVLTYAIIPIVDFLCSYQVRGLSRKFQRLIATTLVFIVMASVVVSVTVAFCSPFQTEINGLSENLHTYLFGVKNLATGAHKWYSELHPDLQKFLQTQKLEPLYEKISNWTGGVINSTYDFLTHLIDIILIPVLAFYFTLDSRSLKREFVALAPKRRAREALAIIHEMNCIMRSYVIGQIILCVIAGVIVGIALHFMGMPYVLLLSILAGVTRAVPVIGPIISGAAIVIVGMAQAPMLGLYLLIFFVILQFAESKFIMPKLIGDRMQLHPAVVIIALLIGAEFFGLIGMFMAAPVAALLRVLIRYYMIKPKSLRVWGLSHGSHEDTYEMLPDA